MEFITAMEDNGSFSIVTAVKTSNLTTVHSIVRKNFRILSFASFFICLIVVYLVRNKLIVSIPTSFNCNEVLGYPRFQ
jgi:hypothetical protein